MKILACFVLLLALSAASAQQAPQQQQAQLREGNFDIRFEPTAILQSNAEIRFDIKVNDALRKPVHGATVTLQIETPDHQGTKLFKAAEMQTGVYMAKPVFPSAGRWNVYVEARRDDKMSARTIEYYVNK